MRIVHLITRLIVGGAQENTLLTCMDLISEHQDEVLLLTGPGLGPEGSLEAEAIRQQIPMQILPELRRNIHPTHDWKSYRAIKREIAKFHPDVVHTHSGKAGLFGRKAAWALRVPAVVHTIHGAPFHAYQGRVGWSALLACERYAAHRCHRLISVANAMTEQMVAAKVAPAEKFTTVYSGMEIEPLLAAHENRERIRAELGYTSEHVVVGKIARLFHLKGHADLITAAQTLCPRFPQLRFLLVGDGLLREALNKQISAAGLSDRFQFTGLVPPASIPNLIAATDMVVHCSLREGLARVLPQALIVGRPVISYDIDGAREVVIPGKTGYLLPPQDITGLTKAIEALAEDVSLRDQLSAAGQELCTPLFEHKSCTQQIRDIYSETLEKQEFQTR